MFPHAGRPRQEGGDLHTKAGVLRIVVILGCPSQLLLFHNFFLNGTTASVGPASTMLKLASTMHEQHAKIPQAPLPTSVALYFHICIVIWLGVLV